MRVPRGWIYFAGACLLSATGFAAQFNEAYAAGVVAQVESILTVPWTQVLDPLKAAFNSRFVERRLSRLWVGQGPLIMTTTPFLFAL